VLQRKSQVAPKLAVILSCSQPTEMTAVMVCASVPALTIGIFVADPIAMIAWTAVACSATTAIQIGATDLAAVIAIRGIETTSARDRNASSMMKA
jgi:hypothetical protein